MMSSNAVTARGERVEHFDRHVMTRSKLAGRVALFSDAGEISMAIAKRFIREGARVLVLSREPNITADFEKEGGTLLVGVPNPDDESTAFATAAAFATRHFAQPISIFVCDGVPRHFEFGLKTNEEKVSGSYGYATDRAGALTQCAIDEMTQGAGGDIVLLVPPQNPLLVDASAIAARGALCGLAQGLAQRYGAQAIRVNAVAPGVLDSFAERHLSEEEKKACLARIPVGRFTRFDDLAAAAVLLAAGTYISGATLFVGGGLG